MPTDCQPGERMWPNDMDRKIAEREMAESTGLDRDGKYDHVWNNSVFIPRDELPWAPASPCVFGPGSLSQLCVVSFLRAQGGGEGV